MMTEIDIATIRALCIVADAHHGAEGVADYAINPTHQRRYAWALDIVRQIARQEMPGLDARLEKAHDRD